MLDVAWAGHVRVAFGSVPKDGGTFSFYRTLRPALLRRGIDLRCISVGRDQAEMTDPAFIDEGCVQLAARQTGLKPQARAFVAWCEAEAIDVVIGVNSPGILSALPHLPQQIRAMSRCANGFQEGYRLTLISQERLSRIVALTPRLRDDLITQYGVDPSQIVLIPNGTSPEWFAEAASRTRGAAPALELGFLGRLEHNQKGVRHLPDVLDLLDEMLIDYRLRIAGRGRDEAFLRAAFRGREELGKVRFEGRLAPVDIPRFLSKIDLFLFPSHFEGCPNALLEAMMAGAVPVAWLLPGITDFIVRQGETGRLARIGDTKAFADAVASLAQDRTALSAMSQRAASDARGRFGRETCANRYAELIKEVMSEPAQNPPRRPWSEFSPDPMLRQSLASQILPMRHRKALRSLVDRARGQKLATPGVMQTRPALRVHHIINSINLDRGGAQRLVRDLHAELQREGIASTLIALQPCSSPSDLPDSAMTFGLDSPYDPRNFLRLAQYARSIMPGDVVHAHLFPTGMHVAALKRAGQIPAPIVFTEHSSFNRRRNSAWGGLVDRQMHGAFARIISISDGVHRELLRSRPWTKEVARTIPNGCRLPFDKPVRRNDRGGLIRIVSVGRLVAAKNYDRALEAIAQLMPANIRYVIAGEGDQRARLEFKVTQLGLRETVEFAGYVPNIRELLEAADIFLIPSAWEGFGLAAVEAMNAALPVVAADVPGLADVVGDDGEAALLVDHKDPASIAHALRRLLNDPSLRGAMGQAGFKRSLDFGMSRFVNSHLELYDAVQKEWFARA